MINKHNVLVAVVVAISITQIMSAGSVNCDCIEKPIVITKIVNNIRTQQGTPFIPVTIMFGIESFNAGPLEPPVLKDNFTMITLNEYWEANIRGNTLYSGIMNSDTVIKAYIILGSLNAANQNVQQVISLFTVTAYAIIWHRESPVRIRAEVKPRNENLGITKPYVDIELELTLDKVSSSRELFSWPMIITRHPE